MLRAIAKYKYLTVSHILQLGISVSKDKSGKYLRSMRKDRKLVGRQTHYSVSPRFSDDKDFIRKHYEDIHYLTRKGVRFLTTHTNLESEHIHFPKNPSSYLANDYLHRISTISSHISFDKWTAHHGATQPLFWTYYKHNRHTKNARFEAQTNISL